MAGVLDDLWTWLTNPTASTQTPTIVPTGTTPTAPAPASTGPMLGGAPHQGLLSGLLGGQQPVNPMSYFQPRTGILGDSILGNAARGAFAGLGSVQPGMRGLGAIGAGAQGGIQEEQQRQQRQMATALAGQQYKSGQQALITGNLTNQLALEKANIFRRHYGLPDLTMDQMIADPSLAYATAPTGGQPQAGGQPGGTTGAATGGAPTGPIAPSVLPSAPATPTIPSPTGVGTNVQPRNAVDQFKQATLQFEGGGDPNKVDQKSGAIAGLTQGTFDLYNKKFFGGKLNFANTADRQAVNNQLINDLYQQAGGDVNRMAAGYFTGQMAPPGSPTPWVDANATDANGTNVVDYVNHIRKNLMLPPLDTGGGAAAQGQQPAGGGQPTGGSSQSIDDAIAAGRVPPLLADAYQSAWDTGDLGKVADAKIKIAEYLAAPQQAAATQQATQATTYGGQQAAEDRSNKLATTYANDDRVKAWRAARPAADAFNAAYQERGKAGGSSDYALVSSALQVLTGQAASRPGTLEYATQLQTLPSQIQDWFQKLHDPNTAVANDAAYRLKQAVDDRIKIVEDGRNTVLGNLRQQAAADKIPEWRYNVDLPQSSTGQTTGQVTQAAPPPPPKVGEVQSSTDGKTKYKFNGGDPGNPNSWSVVP